MKEGVWGDDEEGYKILFCGMVSAESFGLSDEGPGHPIGWFSINIPDPECRPLYSPSHLAKMRKKRGKENEKIFHLKKKIKVTKQPLKAISVRISDLYKHSAAIGSYLYCLGGMEDPSSPCNNPEEDCVEMWRLDLTDPSHWSRGPKMTFPRWDPQTIVLDGKLYALGFLLATDCPSECGWMEVYDPELATWEPLPNPPSPPPSCYQIRRDDFSCAVIESNKEILLVKHFVAEEDNLYFATCYSFNIHTRSWITHMPLKRKLLGSFPPLLDRRAVVVGANLYWAALPEEEHELESSRFYVQAYNLDKDVWLHGTLNASPLFGKHEGARSFDLASPRLLHLRDHFFCLLLHAYSSTSLDYLYCLILKIDDDYKLHKLRISIMSVQKYPMTDVSSLWDNVLLGPG